jgi:hypothetical protein
MEPSFKMLRDPELNERMRTQGYLVLPFLSEDEIQTFRQLHEHHHQAPPPDFYNSYFSEDINYKREIETKVKDHFERKMTKYFQNCIITGGMFVVKPPFQEKHFLPHQDWSFVDEHKSLSLSMWCPLQDVNDHNGNLRVLKGSHQFLETIRGSGTPNVYENHRKVVDAYMDSIPMKAGEALFFFNNLVHGSPPNKSSTTRICLGLTLLPDDAPLLYYFIDPEDKEEKLKQYVATETFYINYVHQRGQKPKDLEFLQTIDFDFPTLRHEELIKKCKTISPHKEIPDQLFLEKEEVLQVDTTSNNPSSESKGFAQIINQFKKFCGLN